MAGFKYVPLPDGRIGRAPAGMSDEEVYSRFGVAAPSTQAPVKRSALGAGLESAASALGTGLPYALSKAVETPTSRQAGDDEYYQSRLRASAAKREEMLPGGPAMFGQGASLGRIMGENLAYSAPQMGAQALAGVGGALVGGPVGAGAAAGAMGSAMYTGTNVDRATEGGQSALTKEQAARSMAVAPAQAAIDVLGARYLPGVGKYLGNKGFSGGALARAAKGTAAGAATEAGGEALQQSGERFSAGLNLADSEAMSEYGQAAAIGGLLGGTFGAVGGVVNKPKAAPAPAPATETGAPADMLAMQGGTFNEKQGPEVRKSVNLEDRVRQYLDLTPDDNVDETIASVEGQRTAIATAMKDAQTQGDMDTFYKLQDSLMQHNEKYFESSDPAVRAKRQELMDAVDAAQVAVAKAKQPKKAQVKLTQATSALKNFDRTENVSPVQEYINARRKEEAKATDTQRDLLGGVGRLPRASLEDQTREGDQYDLFGRAPTRAAINITDAMGRTSDTRQAGPDQEEASTAPLLDTRPLSTVAVDFSQRNILRNLRGSTPLKGAVKGYATSLSAKMLPLFQKQDLVGLQALLEKEENAKGQLATVDTYLPVINRALDMVSDFERRVEEAKRQEINIRAREGQARAAPGTETTTAPAMQDAVSVARAQEQNAQSAVTEQDVIRQAQAEQAQASQTAEDSKRNQILTAVLRNPDITNYYNAYEKQLKDLGMDPTVSEEELATINRAKEMAERRSAGREVFKSTKADELVEELQNAIAQAEASTPPASAERLIAKRDATVAAITKALDFEGNAETDALEAIEKLVGKNSYTQAQSAWQKMMAAKEEALNPTPEPEAKAEPAPAPKPEAQAEPAASEQEAEAETEPEPTPTPPKPRGRPRVVRAETPADAAPKRKRGRPAGTTKPKENPKRPEGLPKDTKAEAPAKAPAKPRGRPKGLPKDTKAEATPAAPARPRGRPKNPVVEKVLTPEQKETATQKAVKEAKEMADALNYAKKMDIFEKVRDEKGSEALNAEQVQAIGRIMESPLMTPEDIQNMADNFKAANKPPKPAASTAPAATAQTAEQRKVLAQKFMTTREANKARMAGVSPDAKPQAKSEPIPDFFEQNYPYVLDQIKSAVAEKSASRLRAIWRDLKKANAVRVGATVETDPYHIAASKVLALPRGETEAKFQVTYDGLTAAMREKSAIEANRILDDRRLGTTAPQAPDTKYRPVSERQNTAQIEARAEVYDVLRAELDRLGLRKAGLQVLTTLEGRDFFKADWRGGFDYNTGLVTVVMQKGRGSNYTLGHEAIHALEHFGMIDAKEKGAVVLWAKSQKDIRKFIEDNYSDKTKDEQDSEYVAEAYARWLQKEDELPGRVRLFFRKIVGFLNAFNSFFRKQGFTSPDMVLEAINAGYFKGRKEGKSTLGYKSGTAAQATSKAYEDASRLAAENVGGVGNRVAAATVIANKLIDMAVKAGIPSARKFERLLAEQGSVIARLDRVYENLSDRFDGLKNAVERGTGKGSINGFIQDMRFHKKEKNEPSGMWGFDPNYNAEDGSKIEVQIDPDLAKQFDALSPEAQQIVRDVFKTSRDNLYAKKKVVMEAFASEYDALIQDANDRGDAKDAAKWEKKKTREISKYDRLMRIDPNKPYAPIKRFGDFVVVGRSQKYLEAEQEAERQKTPEAWEALRKLQEDGEHYYVDYAPDRLAAQRMRDQIAQNYAHPDMFRKDEASNAQMGGSNMFGAFQRMQKLIQEQGDTMDPGIRKRLNALSTELYLQTLAASSSRKAEMTARLVHAGDLDMVRGAIAQGRSDARFIGTIKKNGEIADTLKAMSKEAKGDRMNSDKARELVQQISARHAANLAPMEQNTVVDSVLSLTTGMYLMTSPMFFVQQAMQNFVITLPVAAARHGYSRTAAALQKGYETVGAAWGDSGVTQPLDIDRLQGVDRVLALFLSDRNALDVGIDKDMGNWTSGVNNPTSGAIQTVMKKIGGVTRKLEAINRLSSGKMMFELELEKTTAFNVDPEAYASYLKDFKETHPDLTPFTEKQFAAANESLRIIMDTHGDYSMAAAPTWMRGGFLRIVTQFKKFQIMQLTLYTQAINNAFFDKGVSAAEKEVARKTLLYMTGHAALFAGALGIPGAGAGEWLWEAINKLMGREGPFTAESDLRKAIGNEQLANLLINGAPTLVGIDLSGSLGQGNLVSVAPFAEVPTDEDKYKDFILRLLGPAIGGVGLDYAKGIGFMADGQYYKGLEKMLPKGVSNIVKAFRESSEGVSDKGGETTVGPDKISTGATIATALGVRTTDVSNRQYRQGRAIETKEYFQNKSAKLKREYIAAAAKKNGAKMQELRQEWTKVQAQRAEAGLARQPLSDLIKAPRELAKREKNVIGGVKFTKATRGMAEQLAEETGEEEE